jgi:ribosomal protein S18 acetylase RimI-like enzyme
MSQKVRVIRADYGNPEHAAGLVKLLDAYARDAAGGGKPLSEFAKANLVTSLSAVPHAFSVLAFASDDNSVPVGLANCLEGFSTFECRPLVNVHDLAVLPDFRGQRIGDQILRLVEQIAVERGACKLTLEVLSGNVRAKSLYERFGFLPYALDPTLGQASLMQKWLR